MSDELISIDNASPEQISAIDEITREFELKSDNLKIIQNEFMKQLNIGLEKDNQNLAMIPSFVTGVPTGDETGTYLTLDLGGTNLRVRRVVLEGGGKVHFKKDVLYEVSETLKNGNVIDLFDFIADCIGKFLIEQGDEQRDKIELGFTFSFPVKQTAIDKGILLRWTKGFTCHGAVGNDIVCILQNSLDRKSVPVKVTTLINDTVGTALAHAYGNLHTILGAILGTGTNGAYFENVGNIKKSKLDFDPLEKMVINIEWGAFDSDKKVVPFTRYDDKLDKESNNPSFYIFEKLISGMYLGEITRNVILELIKNQLLFDGSPSKELDKHYAFQTKYMSNIESDCTKDLSVTQKILEGDFKIPKTSLTDRQIIKRICQLVGIRSSRLSAIALASVVSHCGMEGKVCRIGVDGSLFGKYPNFNTRMYKALKELLGENADKIETKYAHNGSSVGAALAAHLANEFNSKKSQLK